LSHWQQNLKGPGILVIGQPFFQKDGDWKDHSLSNFPDDYGRLLNLVEQSVRGKNAEGRPHDILILTGDIHSGRHARAVLPGGRFVHELVASPASRIGPFLTEP